MSDQTNIPRIEVKPEPTPEEMAAIVAAVTAAVSARAEASEQSPGSPETSRWARAGRRAAVDAWSPSSLP